MIFITRKPDTLRALASVLCLIHCLATPFIFIVQASSIDNHSTLTCWKLLDYIFLLISFFSIYRFTQTTTIILNEKIVLLVLDEVIIYVPAISLVAQHL